MKHNRGNPTRGATLVETLVAMAISAAVMGTAIGVYVKGTSGFYNEQGRSYMQFRTRTALDRMATDARGASSFLATATVGSTAYTASPGPSPAACMIMQVPAQDQYGLMYYGAGTGTPNTLVVDTVVYYFNPSDRTLRRTISPAVNVQTNDVHSPRSSYRTAESGVVVAYNVNKFALIFRDRDGAVVASGSGATVASVDIKAQILNTGKFAGESPVSVSGVRLRNVKSASIPGFVKRGTTPLNRVPVQAIFTSSHGAYPVGTVISEAMTDETGAFQLYGLVEGTYTVSADPIDGGPGTVVGVEVAQETDAASVTVYVP